MNEIHSIRALENKLDKAMIKYNEAQSIRKTYEQIVRRLKEERVGFDNQLAAIERTLGAKQRDYDELLLLSGDASHAKETALGEKDRVLAAYEDERKRREKELREKHQVVQLRKQMLERMRHRDKMRNDLLTNHGELDDMAMMTSNAQKQLQIEKNVCRRNRFEILGWFSLGNRRKDKGRKDRGSKDRSSKDRIRYTKKKRIRMSVWIH